MKNAEPKLTEPLVCPPISRDMIAGSKRRKAKEKDATVETES